jgi:hypothetical protein
MVLLLLLSAMVMPFILAAVSSATLLAHDEESEVFPINRG